MSDKSKILAACATFRPIPVEVPELGGTVYIRPLSLGGMSAAQATMSKEPERFALLLIIDCVCDETGKRQFNKADEALILSEFPSGAAQTLVAKITEISALGPKASENAPGN
jgi:hypothetical protein